MPPVLSRHHIRRVSCKCWSGGRLPDTSQPQRCPWLLRALQLTSRKISSRYFRVAVEHCPKHYACFGTVPHTSAAMNSVKLSRNATVTTTHKVDVAVPYEARSGRDCSAGITTHSGACSCQDAAVTHLMFMLSNHRSIAYR